MSYQYENFREKYEEEIGDEFGEWEPSLQKGHWQLGRIMRRIMRDHPFYAAVSSELDIRFSPLIPTAATDGTMIVFHPLFFEEMPMDERLFVMMHEIEHVASMHAIRYQRAEEDGNQMNRKLWNISCDYAINGNIKHINHMGDLQPPVRILLPKPIQPREKQFQIQALQLICRWVSI
jgi:hypothetical protein